MIVVGIDVGTVRVGCAAADSSTGIPFPIAVWPRAQMRAERALLETLMIRKADLLVVGLPLDHNGNRTAQCANIEAFVNRIAKRTSVRIVYVDESFSSDDARERAAAASAHLEEIDAHAACLILERYLESDPSNRNRS